MVKWKMIQELIDLFPLLEKEGGKGNLYATATKGCFLTSHHHLSFPPQRES